MRVRDQVADMATSGSIGSCVFESSQPRWCSSHGAYIKPAQTLCVHARDHRDAILWALDMILAQLEKRESARQMKYQDDLRKLPFLARSLSTTDPSTGETVVSVRALEEAYRELSRESKRTRRSERLVENAEMEI